MNNDDISNYSKETIASSTQGGEFSVAINSDRLKAEQSLWRGVITQALMDAGSNSSKREMIYDRAQAIAWLSGTSPDFYTVCDMADLDPSYVKQRARAAIKRGCAWGGKSVIRKKIAQTKFQKIKRTNALSKKSLINESIYKNNLYSVA